MPDFRQRERLERTQAAAHERDRHRDESRRTPHGHITADESTVSAHVVDGLPKARRRRLFTFGRPNRNKWLVKA